MSTTATLWRFKPVFIELAVAGIGYAAMEGGSFVLKHYQSPATPILSLPGFLLVWLIILVMVVGVTVFSIAVIVATLQTTWLMCDLLNNKSLLVILVVGDALLGIFLLAAWSHDAPVLHRTLIGLIFAAMTLMTFEELAQRRKQTEPTPDFCKGEVR